MGKWRNSTTGVAVIAAAVALTAPHAARAWSPIINDALMWLRWDASTIPVRLAPTWPPPFEATELDALLGRAVMAWAKPDCGQPAFVVEAAVAGGDLDEGDGVTTIVPIDDQEAWNARFGATELARTLLISRARDGVILDADIVVNVGGFDFATAPTCDAERYDLEGTIAHELGHVLGLDHSEVDAATMFNNADPGRCTIRDLDADDAEGICALYPKPVIVEPGPEPMPEPPTEQAGAELTPDAAAPDASVEGANPPQPDGCCGGGHTSGLLGLFGLVGVYVMRRGRGRRASA